MIVAASLIGGASIAAGTFCRAVFMSRSQICGPVIWRGPTDGKPRIALTFDDGPHPDGTPGMLDLLRAHDVPATFFLIGSAVEQHASIVTRIVDEGHLIGNHSFTHVRLGTMHRRGYWRTEIALTDAAIQSIIGRRPAFFRPPMGFKTFHIMRAARENEKTVISWTRRARDGCITTADRIMDRLGRPARGGDIMCLHDGFVPAFDRNLQATFDALPRLIADWRARGLTIVRLDDLLELDGYLDD